MVSAQPHFLLFSEAELTESTAGRWRFQLESADGKQCLEASDLEVGVEGERLELLAVVRGLEALDQPSRVTLVTTSRRISLGFRYGLEEWRQNGWRWERDGRWFPIKNQDLWQRVDRALKFHRVRCRTWRFDAEHAAPVELAPGPVTPTAPRRDHAVARPSHWRQWGQRLAIAAQGWMASAVEKSPFPNHSQLTT